jgi:hypothetical protein
MLFLLQDTKTFLLNFFLTMSILQKNSKSFERTILSILLNFFLTMSILQKNSKSSERTILSIF